MRYEQRLDCPDFTVKDIDILHVSRDTHYKHSYHNGRVKHGFIYTVKGRMENDFLDVPGERVSVEAGELIFIPEGCRYFGTYAEAGTEIMIVQFSLADGRLPHYLASPVKLSFPKAGEAMEAFFKPNENHMVGSPYYYYACVYDLLHEIDEVCGGLCTYYDVFGQICEIIVGVIVLDEIAPVKIGVIPFKRSLRAGRAEELF